MENVSGDPGEEGPTVEVGVAGLDDGGAGAGAHCTSVAATTASTAGLVTVVVVTRDQPTEGLTSRRRVRLVALMTSVS